MNELSALRKTLGSKTGGVRVGVIVEVRDNEAIVRFDTGALRKVYGVASVGDRVTVREDRILSKVAAGSERTVYVA